MKPNFSLSLSFEGIRLLHRAAGGWRVVGEVPLDVADLGADLEGLRQKALTLDPGGVETKLILPNDQIKYLTIDTPGMNAEARREAAALALDGATPYAVADLAFDICTDGDQTHIAAVARETMAEAEGFATQYRFHPLCYVAVPDNSPFLGEPFFGATAASDDLLEPGDTVEPDGIAVVVIGDVEWPEAADEALLKADNAEGAEPKEDTAEVKDAGPQAEPDAAPDADPVAVDRAVEDAPEAAAQEDDPLPVLPPLKGAKEARPDAAPVEDIPPPPKREGTSAGFASRRGNGASKAPVLGAASRAVPPTPAPAADASVTAPGIPIEPDSSSFEDRDPSPAPAPAKSGFLSRRKAKPETAPAEDAHGGAAASETERLTVFGARKTDVRGKPRFLGLILTAVLLIFLAGVAAWASVFMDEDFSLSRLFGGKAAVEQAQDSPPALPAEDPVADAAIETASLDPALSDEDGAVLDALREPAQPALPEPMTEAELEANYATSGIWPRAPDVPPEPASLIDIDDFYLTSIDPVSTANDAVALPPADNFATDLALAAVSSPVAAGTRFALDARGLVRPTAQGALSPDGITVFLGKPPVIPPATPTRFQSVPQDLGVRDALAAFRPKLRPGDLEEQTERARLDGLTRSELAGLRPVLRPLSVQEAARAQLVSPADTNEAVAAALSAPEAAEDPFDSATRQAVAASIRPDTRPRNFARIVKRAERSTANDEVRVASAAAVAPRTVKPKIPSKTSVAKQATVKNAINLKKVNLIGVYGKPSSRRALVRLSNGRYKKVVVGDRIDGGRVSAIGDSELRYTKRGRNVVLKMPKG
ncbi:hypothetical protein JQT66_15055 [Sulfitobacter mediterraneus]|uniref:hypothetical protein n=1 Tax=Sulfitobacter mediterraneus TaxID=83219 RepID=UPI0019333CE3|nr:hypothetical protein [Sulfitobacter mediterraneus]MBM1311557.1 hypothetical protein [Sulfitobacter mediterraneus]MBM1315439.1 hypothetical protein [Sulfitobacter mediterraneus]MBM1323800.1 hypothetical protein [Sulfitobacter mediterraneus]MBM1327712.1 hypothetical protein [Sulfitobacter mediterraneus]MBM1399060.1 hypothetical protein [Sulfitobacter mediterraneus]